MLRQSMRDMLLAAAASLDEVPANEQIVIGVSMLYRPEEDRSGLPGQILMQGEKSQAARRQARPHRPRWRVSKEREFLAVRDAPRRDPH